MCLIIMKLNSFILIFCISIIFVANNECSTINIKNEKNLNVTKKSEVNKQGENSIINKDHYVSTTAEYSAHTYTTEINNKVQDKTEKEKANKMNIKNFTSILENEVTKESADEFFAKYSKSADDRRKTYIMGPKSKTIRKVKLEPSSDSDNEEKDVMVKAVNSEGEDNSDGEGESTTPGPIVLANAEIEEKSASENKKGNSTGATLFDFVYGISKSFGVPDNVTEGIKEEVVRYGIEQLKGWRLLDEFQNITGANSQDSYDAYNKLIQGMYMGIIKYAELRDRFDNQTGLGIYRKELDDSKAVGDLRNQTAEFWSKIPFFKNIFGETCFREIGCFSSGEYEDWSRSAIAVLPMAPEYIYPTFHLFTLTDKIEFRNLSYNSTKDELLENSFDPKLKTILIVHGLRSGLEPWMINLKDFIFSQSNEYNVICVNWERGSKVPMFHLAVSNTRVVGALMAVFIKKVCQYFDIQHDRFWLIGHSLGGHVVGFAGKRIKDPKVARITSLEPSGPGYHFENPDLHLDIGDGEIVEVWHTDVAKTFSEGLGTDKRYGHFELFLNGGLMQPGCTQSRGIGNIVHAIYTGEDISCSHSRAHGIAGSIGAFNSECIPVAYHCDNYETFIEGRCIDCSNKKCHPVSLFSKYWDKIKPDNNTRHYHYYVNTSPHKDFCIFHYQIALHITKDSDSTTGLLAFTIYTAIKNKTKDFTFERIMSNTEPGHIHTLLVTFDFKLVKIDKLQLKWKPFAEIVQNEDENVVQRINKGSKLKVSIIEVNFMSHMEKSVREANSAKLCPKAVETSAALKQNQTMDYIKCKLQMKKSARDLSSDQLKAFTIGEDLYSVDYRNSSNETVFAKIENSTFQVKTQSAK